MTKKKTTDQIVTAFRLINNAKLSKMQDEEKFAVIKVMRQLKKVNTDFEDFIKDAQEKLRPEGFAEIASKMQSNRPLTDEETTKVNKYNKDVSDCISPELAKEHELTFDPIDEDAMGRFLASNDFSIAEIMAICDIIGE